MSYSQRSDVHWGHSER